MVLDNKQLVNDHQVIVDKEMTDVLANKDKPATNVESSRKDKQNLNGMLLETVSLMCDLLLPVCAIIFKD